MAEMFRRNRSLLALCLPVVALCGLLALSARYLLSQEPEAGSGISATPVVTFVGQPVSLTASLAQVMAEVPQPGEGQQLLFRYSWDLGEAALETTIEASTTHSYSQKGVYHASVSLQAAPTESGPWETVATSGRVIIWVLAEGEDPGLVDFADFGDDDSMHGNVRPGQVAEPGSPDPEIESPNYGAAPGTPTADTVLPNEPSSPPADPPPSPLSWVTIGLASGIPLPPDRTVSLPVGHTTALTYQTNEPEVNFSWRASGSVSIDPNGTVNGLAMGTGTVDIEGVKMVDGFPHVISDRVPVQVSPVSTTLTWPWDTSELPYLDVQWTTCNAVPFTPYAQGFFEIWCYIVAEGNAWPEWDWDQYGQPTGTPRPDNPTTRKIMDVARDLYNPAWFEQDNYEGGLIDGWFTSVYWVYGVPPWGSLSQRVQERCGPYFAGCPCPNACQAPQIPITVVTSPAHEHSQCVGWIIDDQHYGVDGGGPVTISPDANNSFPGYSAFTLKPVRKNWSGWIAVQAKAQCGSTLAISRVRWIRYKAGCTTPENSVALGIEVGTGHRQAGATGAYVIQNESVPVTASATTLDEDGNPVAAALTYHWEWDDPNTSIQVGGTPPPPGIQLASGQGQATATFNFTQPGTYQVHCWVSEEGGAVSPYASLSVRVETPDLTMDVNNDGQYSAMDQSLEETPPGMVLLVNGDNDDSETDNVADNENDRLDGAADRSDLATLQLHLPADWQSIGTAAVRLKATAGAERIRVFRDDGQAGEVLLGPGGPSESRDLWADFVQGSLTLLAEGVQPGPVTLELECSVAGASSRDTVVLSVIAVTMIDAAGATIPAAELYNGSPSVNLSHENGIEICAADITLTGNQRTYPVAGFVSDYCLLSGVRANGRDFVVAYPDELGSSGVPNGPRIEGYFGGAIQYSRSIDVPIRVEAENAFGNVAADGYLAFLERYKGIGEFSNSFHPRAWNEKVVVENEDRSPDLSSSQARFFRFRVVGLGAVAESGADCVNVSLGDALGPVTVPIYKSDSDFVTPLLLAYDRTAALPDQVRLRSGASLALANARVRESIGGTCRQIRFTSTRLPAQLGYHPQVSVHLGRVHPAGVNTTTSQLQQSVSGIRILSVPSGAVVSRIQPLAGCELVAPTGTDAREKFAIELAHPALVGDEVAVSVVGTSRTDDPLGASVNTVALERGANGIFRSDPNKPLVATVSRTLPITDAQGNISWDAAGSVMPNTVDPGITVIDVQSGGYLEISVANLNLGPVKKLLRPKYYLTMGDSLTAGFNSGVLRGVDQDYCHGALTASQMGLPFSVSTVEGDKGLFWDFFGLFNLTPFDLPARMVNLDLFQFTPSLSPGNHNNVGITGHTLVQTLTNSFVWGMGAGHLKATLPVDPLTGVRATQVQSAIRQRPSLITCWIGANDALGAVIGGVVIGPQGWVAGDGRTRQGYLYPGPLTNALRFDAEYTILTLQMKAIQDAYGADTLFALVPDPTILRNSHLIAYEHGTAEANHVGKTPFGHRSDLPPCDLTARIDAAVIEARDSRDYPDLTLAQARYLPYTKILAKAFWWPFLGTPGMETMTFAEGHFLTQAEVETIEDRVRDFNDAVVAWTEDQGFRPPFDPRPILEYVGRGSVQVRPAWRYQGHTLTLGRMGGFFGADLIHPTRTGQAIVADALIQTINAGIVPGTESFGGFTQPIPRIDNPDVPGGDMLSSVATHDWLLQYILMER